MLQLKIIKKIKKSKQREGDLLTEGTRREKSSGEIFWLKESERRKKTLLFWIWYQEGKKKTATGPDNTRNEKRLELTQGLMLVVTEFKMILIWLIMLLCYRVLE